jgi:hypothetical protein
MNKNKTELIEVIEKLAEFARRVIKQECWGYGDLDGGDIQEWAEKLGLIYKDTATKEDVGDSEFYYFEEGDDIYRFTDILSTEVKDVDSSSPGADARG